MQLLNDILGYLSRTKLPIDDVDHKVLKWGYRIKGVEYLYYDYELFNDHISYRLFSITLYDSKSIEIEIVTNILNITNKIIKNLNDFITIYLDIMTSTKVKDVINKMSNENNFLP